MAFIQNKVVAITLFLAFCSQTYAAEIGHLIPRRSFNPTSNEILSNVKETCGTVTNRVHYFPVEANSPLGIINFYYVQYSAARGLPVSTTTYHDALNHQENVPRVDNFRKYPCSDLDSNTVQGNCKNTYKMTDAQKAKSGNTAFDRGHISPVNPYRFHASAVNNTYFCVNIAPQEPYTNQNPWAAVEDRVHRRTAAGFVMTGLCQANSADGPTFDGVQVPDCFWKLLCYKDGSSTRVVGFIGENSLFDKNDAAAKSRRSADTLTARSQQEVITRSGGGTEISKAWTSAAANLLGKRQANLAPNAADCISTKTLPAAIKDQWSRATFGEFDPDNE